jgi:hypothetical protein
MAADGLTWAYRGGALSSSGSYVPEIGTLRHLRRSNLRSRLLNKTAT